MPVCSTGLAQTVDNCFIHTVAVAGEQTAAQLVGRIYRQDTGGRDKPPTCLSKFETAGTPFALGHVMALELGGRSAAGRAQGVRPDDQRDAAG